MNYLAWGAIGCSLLLGLTQPGAQGQPVESALLATFQEPPARARPWAFWYWMQASVTRAGIARDLEAMAGAGIGGAYLMPIKGPAEPPHMEPVNQLSPEWWAMVRFAFETADRLGLKLTLHACDGFAVAGGPWITPGLSMQKVVWSETRIAGGGRVRTQVAQPETLEGFYRDIAVYAIPVRAHTGVSTRAVVPRVTTSEPGMDASFLAAEDGDGRFQSSGPSWIQYAFAEPFTARSIRILPDGTNYWAKRLRLEASDDGHTFFAVRQLESPRHGWQDADAALTYSIPATRARFFRLVHDPAGTEPGAEDLDSAKWRPSLKVRRITLSAEPRLHQFEGKSGAVWRISAPTPPADLPAWQCVRPAEVLRLDALLAPDGTLDWQAPEGEWLVLRMGHTSTGKTNYIGGAGKGLEADKFNPAAAELQFDQWFGEAIRQVGPELAGRVLHGFHVDSWECGSQNWSPLFRQAFIDDHGYDPLDWLPAMAGIPLASAAESERFLHDIRASIARLLNTGFFGTMKRLAAGAGVVFSAESVAPTMVSDGLLHHGTVDIPMGEFWLRSPTHDKPNDILDAVSGGHIYGKNLIQAEAFTELRMAWDEHPGNLKAVGDRNLALGINRFVFHVFTHNPWTDRAPGMTLDGVGLYFQRDQTWWRPGRAWLDYLARCQALLQAGRPRADIAVFTGEELPRRALLPDRLVDVLPGLVGAGRLAAHAGRLRNDGQPLRELPKGVFSAANMEDPRDWTDPLGGYAYDSINPDALLRLARVHDGRISLPGGASYGLLAVPGSRRMAPQGHALSAAVVRQLYRLVHDGATVLLQERPVLRDPSRASGEVDRMLAELWGPEPAAQVGGGRVLRGPWRGSSLGEIGLPPAVTASEPSGPRVHDLAWNERVLDEGRLYFVSNQRETARRLVLSFNQQGRVPELWDPLTGEAGTVPEWRAGGGRTEVALDFEPHQAWFVVFREQTGLPAGGSPPPSASPVAACAGPWTVSFAPESGGPAAALVCDSLFDWSTHADPRIRFYSGTAAYATVLELPADEPRPDSRYFLDLGGVDNLAEVAVNGVPCGTAWTRPMRVEVTRALRPGANTVAIRVTNTWANRLIGDQALPEPDRRTWTTAPYRLDGSPLLPAGLSGPVLLYQSIPAK